MNHLLRLTIILVALSLLLTKVSNNDLTSAQNLVDYGNGNKGYGYNNRFRGWGNYWVGLDNRIYGAQNSVIGNKNNLTGNNNDIKGNQNDINGHQNIIRGENNIVQGKGNTVISNSNLFQQMGDSNLSFEDIFKHFFSNDETKKKGTPQTKNKDAVGINQSQQQATKMKQQKQLPNFDNYFDRFSPTYADSYLSNYRRYF